MVYLRLVYDCIFMKSQFRSQFFNCIRYMIGIEKSLLEKRGSTMKAKNLAKLGLLGLLGVTTSCQNAGNKKMDSQGGHQHRAGSMSEEELLMQLDNEGKALYYSLNEEGKALAIQLASATCAASNSCKGMNSCKSANNPCAGQGECKGSSACGFTDKNLAVKVAAKHMVEKMEKMDY